MNQKGWKMMFEWIFLTQSCICRRDDDEWDPDYDSGQPYLTELCEKCQELGYNCHGVKITDKYTLANTVMSFR